MFLQKSFIGKNKWYLYLLVLVLVFVLAQVGGIPFAVYAMMKPTWMPSRPGIRRRFPK